MIYLASPYSHSDKTIVEKRVEIISKYAAKLLSKRMHCVSPILIGTTIFKYATLPSDFEFWQHLSYDLLKRCDMIIVLKLEGWQESIGVQAEINFAIKNNIKVEYADTELLLKL